MTPSTSLGVPAWNVDFGAAGFIIDDVLCLLQRSLRADEHHGNPKYSEMPPHAHSSDGGITQ